MESILRKSSLPGTGLSPRTLTDSPIRRSESSLAKVFPNMSEMLSREDRNQLKRIKAKRQRLRPNQTVSIDDSPMMILPKARVRNDYNHLTNRMTSVVSADDTAGLHLSTVPGFAIIPKTLSKSLRSHHHSSRSDADSGIGSMKRSVTFDEISLGRSSVKSIDDFDAMSEITEHECKNSETNVIEPFPDGRYDDMPSHVETFSDNAIYLPELPKKKQRKQSITNKTTDNDDNHEANCPICRGFTSERERVKRYFGGVDAFFKWFWSRWGKRTDAGNVRRRNLGFQGSRPRFCNIVRSMQLHSRDSRDFSPCTGDSGFDEFDYITRDGRLINRWRKDSGVSYEEETSDVFEPTSIPERPETKQDDLSKRSGTGLDGKPGTPTSIEDDLDRMELNNTGLHEDDNSKLKTTTDNDDHNKLLIPDDIDKDDNGAVESPTQPPPTPEIAVRVEIKRTPSPPLPTPPKKKTCITKKTLEKKPFNKVKKKEEMEKPVEIPREPTSPPPPEVVEEKKEPEIKVNLPEPSLPDVTEKPHKQKKEKLKPEKFAIPKHDKPKTEEDTLFDETLTNQLKKFELMVSDMASPEETPRKHTNKPLKITGRLALSQQSSRFTLPMDMRDLETMSTKDYVLLYCKITKRRQNLYDNVYRQTVGATTKPLPYKELEKALRNVLVDTLNNEHFKYICELLEIKEGEDINAELFSKMAALAERLLYPQYVTKETEDHKDYQKQLIEVADFSALEWKFHGVNVRPEIQKLLKTLC